MASLGARLLAPDKRVAEAENTVGMRREGEVSILATLAKHVSRQITLALEEMAEWMDNATGEIAFTLNTDFNVSRLDANHIKSLLESVVAGLISYETFYDTLVDGEAVKTGRTFQEEQELVAVQNGAAHNHEDDEEPKVA